MLRATIWIITDDDVTRQVIERRAETEADFVNQVCDELGPFSVDRQIHFGPIGPPWRVGF